MKQLKKISLAVIISSGVTSLLITAPSYGISLDLNTFLAETGLTQLAQNVGGASLHHAVIQIRPNTYERLGVLVAELNN